MVLEDLNEAIIQKIIQGKPVKFITLDKLFKENDQLKANTLLQMKDAGIEMRVM